MSGNPEEIQNEDEVPRGYMFGPGHQIFMVAAYDGYCYLVNKESGYIYWRVPTNDFLCIVHRGEKVDDYAGIRQVDYENLSLTYMCHFQPNRPFPQLIPYDTEALLKEHFDEHYKDAKTLVSKEEKYYLIDYQDGSVRGSYDSEEELLKNDNRTDYFLIRRVDFYMHRSSPLWSVRFASVEAWFPGPNRSHKTCCYVYHAPTVQSYINICIAYEFNNFPTGCSLNDLITNIGSLSLENISLEEGKAELQEQLNNNLIVKDAKESRMELDTFKPIERDDKGSQFFHGRYDEVDALVEMAKSGPIVRETVKKLRSSSFHPNLCAFLDWEIDGDSVYYIYERCARTFKDYIHDEDTKYEEMSEQSTKIIRGLLSGIAHLRSRDLVHTKLSLENIWISDEGTVKIGGVGKSVRLKPENDGRRRDLKEVGKAILAYISKGKYKPSGTLVKSEFDLLEIPGTNAEVWDLLRQLGVGSPVPRTLQSPARLTKHISLFSAPDRLKFFKDLSCYLEDTDPKPTSLITALRKLTVVPKGNNRSDWSTKFDNGVLTAMENVPDRSVAQPSVAEASGSSGSAEPQSSKTRKANYNYTCPVNLIRFMRNGATHIHSFSSRQTTGDRTLADDLGSNEIEFEKTFRYLFPDLLVIVYEEVEKHLVDLPDSLKIYYQA